MKTFQLSGACYPEIVRVWEASVRATHDFLEEEYILEIRRKLSVDYLPNLNLYGINDEDGSLSGFVGIGGNKIETLFVEPNSFGKGVGKALLLFAVNQLGADSVDVNEENPRARAFYKKNGFAEVSRDELDSEGRPHPILHLKLHP